MSTEEPELTQDVIFDVLSSARRRYVLYNLNQRDEPVKLTDLATEVAAWEMDTSADELSPQERKRVYVSLYQTHVPKLREVGLVEYDQDSGLVELTNRSDDIAGYLRESPSFRDRLERYGLILAVSLALLLGGILLLPTVEPSVELFTLVVVWAGFVLGATYFLLRWNGDGRFPRTLRRQ